MSSITTRRILKDLKEIESENSDYFHILPNEDNIFEWQGFFLGPEDSYYSGSILPISVLFPKDYPNKPPQVNFPAGLVFHPNIFENGSICLDVLQNKWSPMMNIKTVILSLMILLREPNISSPANPKAAKLFDENLREFKRIVWLKSE